MRHYNKILKVLLMIFLISSADCYAETVSQKQAREYAQKFFNIYYNETVAPVTLAYNGKRLTTQRLFTPFYVYNEPRGGFVIISAENKVFPILGFSLTDSFNADKLSPAETALLRNYALDIEEIRYDGNVPEQAIASWRDYDDYVHTILSSQESESSSRISREDAAEKLNMLWTTDAGLDSYADLYTPDQWQAMVDNELSVYGSAALGYIDNGELYPSVIYGHKGDYYRIDLDSPNNWYMRLMAGEIAGDRQLLSTLNPTYQAPVIVTDEPFEFYESFVRSVEEEKQKEEKRRLAIIDQPIVKDNGGGHFDVLMPENVSLAMLYNVGGSHIGRRTYRDTNVAHINIESEPAGFYFALVIGESGRPYGIKLYR